jgi:DNA mismatch repair protein MutS
MKSLTPMLKQYLEIKNRYPDSILFYRIGDFYEMFFEDALVGSRELEIVLTSRAKAHKDSAPLCGVPHHAAESYITRLLQKGYKVAVCEQVEDPKTAKGIVRREVIRVYTPGLLTDSAHLKTEENNYLMGFCCEGEVFGVAFLDISTGECKALQIPGLDLFLSETVRNEPREILALKSFQEHPSFEKFRKRYDNGMVTFLEDSNLDGGAGDRLLRDQGALEAPPLSRRAVSMVLGYAEETQRRDVSHIRPVVFYRLHDFMIIDETSKRNLELTRSLSDGGKKGSLYGILDETITAMGNRRLKAWLQYPLLDVHVIEARLEAVSELKEKKIERKELRASLNGVQDLERLTSRIFLGHAHARDLLGLNRSIESLPSFKAVAQRFESPLLSQAASEVDTFDELHRFLDSALMEDPPLSLKEGGIIKPGFNQELDELRQITRQGRGWILKLEADERSKTGVSSLKVRYNQVFGYYIEVTKSNLHLVPAHYQRKQTLANAERFTTPELKAFESKVLGAEEAICQLEYRLFEEVRREVSNSTLRLQQTASAVAMFDVTAALAEVADRHQYVRPQVNEGDEVVIVDGRHPVLETTEAGERFVPNDTRINGTEHQVLIITGPNMAGKSTYLRQVALIVLMAQMGSFVPAGEARIGVVDRLFTRIGASDNITRGQSTFMVEMTETAQILNQATDRSLIVLDEIGRGTSTFDGLSIAWAVAEYLHDHPSFRPKTLFATHYHELTELTLTKERIKNLNVAVKEWNGEIIFLRKILEGGASRSYGIQVARLAGLPQKVIERAKEILSNLESSELDALGMPKLATSKRLASKRQSPAQLSLFVRADPLRAELSRLNIDSLTPLEALNVLHELKKRAEPEE